MADPEPVNAPWKKDDKLVSQGRGVWTAIVTADLVWDGHMPIRGTRPDGSTFLDWAHPDDWELAPPPARTVRDVIPATDEEVEKWRITAEIQNPALDSARVLAMIARIDAEKARADQAEAERDAKADLLNRALRTGGRIIIDRDRYRAERDALRERLTLTDEERGTVHVMRDSTDPMDRRLLAIIDHLTGEAEADG